MVRSLIPMKNYRKRHSVKFYYLSLKNLKLNVNGIKNGNTRINDGKIEGKTMTYPEFCLGRPVHKSNPQRHHHSWRRVGTFSKLCL